MTTVNSEVFKKFKHAAKLPQRPEADGHEIEVEFREDEEQSVKLQEIIDLLVAAGYFRARIRGLTPFDKVVGGMTWCIESCNIDLNVDLLFRENLTIGQKIALTEKIVAVLPKMQCPHAIEPHQIQGLDFIHIFPVIQWLVKRSMENRQEISAFVRSYAVNQFNKQFNTDKPVSHQKELENLNTVTEIYRPQRYFKRKNVLPHDINSRVQITLLEYGYRGGDKQGTNAPHETEESIEKEEIAQEGIHYDDLNEEEKENLLRHYASLHMELKEGSGPALIINQTQLLKEQLKSLKEKCKQIETKKLSVEEELKTSRASLEEIKAKQVEADRVLNELEEFVNNQGSKDEVEELVKQSDTLKAQEAQFKENCKKEIAKLQNLIEEIKKTKHKITSDNTNCDILIAKETERVRKLRLQIAKKNRNISSLQRQLDDVPNRAELSQYQRRFLELYNQVAAKHQETKQYYSLYNTQDDTHNFMKKQLSLMNSIVDNYPDAMQSTTSKEEFLVQFESILDRVVQTKVETQHKLVWERNKRDMLSETLHTLIEQQRRYVAAVRELSIECKKHETLLAQTQNAPRKL